MQNTTSTEKKQIIIKRYQNRKLYDTINSCYVTLEDIAGMIRKGDDIKVIDNKTRADLTSVTLTQIIFEEEKKQNSLLPLNMLRKIIMGGGDVIREFVSHTLGSREGELDSQTDGNTIRDIFLKTQDISKNIEEKIKTTVDSLTQISHLQAEIRKLRQRTLYLEKRLRSYEK